MAKLWSTKDFLGRHDGEILFLHHRLNHCSFKSLLRVSNMGVISRNLSRIINSPLFRFFIWKFSREAMEDQRQTLKRFNQKTLGDQNRSHDFNQSYVIFPTRSQPSSQWGSKPRNILGRYRIHGSLLRLLLNSSHEGNLI